MNPSARHRVYHASDAACIDRDDGGVLSIFGRLFGTYAEAPADEPLRYGLAGRMPTLDPARIALGEWAAMIADAKDADRWTARVRHLCGPPGPLSAIEPPPSPPNGVTA